jgi:tRNA(Ile)-lysidine synthase
MVPEPVLLDRFRSDLDSLTSPKARLGIAVSGGPDSLALLLLAVAARPGLVEAATVDHALRPESSEESATVARLCVQLDVPHAVLPIAWSAKPTTAIQERAREERYALLAGWARERGLEAIATAHHADDQAETVLMRLNRGAGVRGLAGMRPSSVVPGSDVTLIRPLLCWRRSELAQVCAAAGLQPIADPSNADQQFERVRIRRQLADAPALDPAAIARSAAHLAAADEALDWLVESLALVRVVDDQAALRIDPSGLPRELQRRLLLFAFARFETDEPRGAELARALDGLVQGRTVTLGGLKLEGGRWWRVSKAPARRRTSTRSATEPDSTSV